MSKVDQEFQTLCKKIKSEGREYENKNRGVKRLQIPSYTFRHKMADGFPAITNKKLYWKGIVGELIWFLKGDNDVKYLNDNGITIWNKDAYNWYKRQSLLEGCPEDKLLTFEEFSEIGTGSVWQNYSVQWRNFNDKTDQITDLLRTMSKDIMSSRLKVNAWNPSETDETALPPCHSEFQIIGVPLTREEIIEHARTNMGINLSRSMKMDELDKLAIPKFGFELHWNQRSVDTFLGLPFNIASYGLLAKIIEQFTGYPALAIEGTLKCVHFYDNQYEAVDLLLERDPDTHPNCTVSLPEIDVMDTSIDSILSKYEIADFKLVGYSSDANIKVDMLAPKE